MLEKAFTGSRKYYAWIVLLLTITAVGFITYFWYFFRGEASEGLSQDVSWGLYIANYTFFVGVAASAVMMVLPYYWHDVKAFGRITVFGELLAVVAITMAGLFVIVDLGQPTRLFNIYLHPNFGSTLFWNVFILPGYLLLNLVAAWLTLRAEYKSRAPSALVKPLILISIPWAISIHTATAFVYSGLAARPFWLTALLAPRFLASAFASGPALLIILCLIIKRFTKFDPGREAIQKVAMIVTYAMVINVFFLVVEIFTAFYSQIPEELNHFRYLLFGLEGQASLVPWMWISIVLALVAIVLLVNPGTRQRTNILILACVAVFVSIWIDKGLGLVVTGFIPSTSGIVFEYWPTVPEAVITLGIWALGFLILTILYKIAISVREEKLA